MQMAVLLALSFFLVLPQAKATALNQDQPTIEDEFIPSLSSQEIQSLPCVQNKTCYLAEHSDDGLAPIVWKAKTENLVLLGSGLVGKSSKEGIAVACIDKAHACTEFQFVNFVNPGEVYLLGPRFTVAPMMRKSKVLTEKETIFRLAQEELQGRGNRNYRGAAVFGGSLLVGAGAVALTATVWPILVPLVVGMVAASQGGDTAHLDFLTPVEKKLSKSKGGALVYQSRWNWSENPVRVKEAHFSALLDDLFSSVSDSHGGPIPEIFAKYSSFLQSKPLPDRMAYQEYILDYKKSGRRAREALDGYFGDYEIINCSSGLIDGSNLLKRVSLSLDSSTHQAMVTEENSDGTKNERSLTQEYRGSKNQSSFNGFTPGIVTWTSDETIDSIWTNERLSFGPNEKNGIHYYRKSQKYKDMLKSSVEFLGKTEIDVCLRKVEVQN